MAHKDSKMLLLGVKLMTAKQIRKQQQSAATLFDLNKVELTDQPRGGSFRQIE
jgi:hypothetical protein